MITCSDVRIIVGLSGATGSIYGVRLLERLREMDVETHLVISRWGARTLAHETPHTREYVESLATTVYPPGDMGAAIRVRGAGQQTVYVGDRAERGPTRRRGAAGAPGALRGRAISP